MSHAARGLTLPRPTRSWIAAAQSNNWLPSWSSAAALRAVRATVVLTSLFWFTDKVIGNLQMATFAAFGSFATLVLSSFAGSRGEKLRAHLALAIAGSVLLTIGTAVSGATLLAALVTVPVAFSVFFAGVAGPNAAGGVTGALLAYVLPAASPGTIGMVPDRLAGWWLASVAGTAAVLALSPRPPGDALKAASAKLARALADELDAALAGTASADRLDELLDAKRALMAQFGATPYRPTGLTVPDQALANCVELLEWCTALVADAVRERADLREVSPADRELLAAASATLRGVAALFQGGSAQLDLAPLRGGASVHPEHASPAARPREAEQAAFHAHAIASAVLALGTDAQRTRGVGDPEEVAAAQRGASPPVGQTAPRASLIASTVLRDASVRSVWFINAVRGGVALGAAVAVADLSSVQHGFWVVLGTLSVLRTSAASTGATALRALAGTAVGFVIGGALLVAIGADPAALWVALPVAVLVAAYTPGTAPFAVGQAAFTVVIAVLFNLLVPVGWKVGVVRIEDVALGCAVSVLVGFLFWPRGLGGVIGDDLADAFRSGAAYLTQAVHWACGSRTVPPDAAPATNTAALRLDDALRAFIAEQGSKRVDKQQLWRLVGGTLRLRLTADAVARMAPDPGAANAARAALDHRTATLAEWYDRLADVLDSPPRRALPALAAPSFSAADVVDGSSGSRYAVWLCEHLDHLSEQLGELVPPALRVAEIRRKPWWR